MGQVFGLPVGGGDDEAERLRGTFAYRGGEIGQQGRVGSGDGSYEGAGTTLGSGYGGRGADGGPAFLPVEKLQEGVQRCGGALFGRAGGAHGFS